MPLDDDADEDADDEELDAAGFESEPDDLDEDVDVADAEPDAFAGDVAGVLLDEEPRLSFR